MSNTHTDAQLMIVSQIAYLNIDVGPGGHPRNILRWMDSNYEAFKHSDNPADIAQAATIDNIRNLMSKEGYENLGLENWTVIDSCDFNGGTGSGMYSAVVDTGDGNAVIGFRGSESYDTEQSIKDWAIADFGLLNNPLTAQQADAQEYTRRVLEKYGDQYDSFDTTGHSLGGNLAEHALITVPEEYRDKMGRGVNLDGPGFSDEYILTHAVQIAAMSGKADHCAWSLVGALLISLPGSNYQVIDAVTPDGDLFQRHATNNVIMKDGSVQPGTRDPLAEALFHLSKMLELQRVSLFMAQISVALMVLNAGLHILGNGLKWIIETIKEMLASHAEFSVQTGALTEAGRELAELSSLERQISYEVAEISNKIIYNSIGGYYCKNKIRNIAGAIAYDADSARRLGIAVERCAIRYEKSDKRAEALLAI